jgi:hypothetical protein
VALEKSLKIRPEGSASSSFLLAMTQWQLADRVAAQRSYEQAVECMEKNGQNNKELRELRADAAALLGEKSASSVAAAGQDEPVTQKKP